MVPYPFLSLALLFVSLLFPLACSSSRGIFLQHVSPIALELLLVSNKYIIYPMSCQDSVKIPGLLHNISKCVLIALSLVTKSEFPPHLFGHTELSFSPVLFSPFLVTCWVVWLCGKLCARSGSAVPATQSADLCLGPAVLLWLL